jgi:hypothetical protein
MTQRGHQQMTSGVGIAVKHHQGMIAPEQDQPFTIVFSPEIRAEDTAFLR